VHHQPTPAIVAQSAVHALPRWALVLLCLAYVLPGFVARDPWRMADMEAFGYMRELALGGADWLHPTLADLPPPDGLLAYWLGAFALQVLHWAAPNLGGEMGEMAARLPFMVILTLSLLLTWRAVYYLARMPGAGPVAFAFGGEAHPRDYARALADASLLALLACLGLAQLAHESSAHLLQLGCTALVFFAAAAMPARPATAGGAALVGLGALALGGAPTLACVLGTGCAALAFFSREPLNKSGRIADAAGLGAVQGESRSHGIDAAQCPKTSMPELPGLVRRILGPAGRGGDAPRQQHGAHALLWLAASLGAAALAWSLDVWAWRVADGDTFRGWRSLGLLLLWFGWPAWPLALWTLWVWRRQIARWRAHPHLSIPLLFATVALAATMLTPQAERALLLGLPALAALAAFALPTLRRSISAIIDWFTLLFFSASALTIWVIWLSLQTGVPAKPAANVARLAPHFTPQFSVLALAVAALATLAWCALVAWRGARHRTPFWKSLVLPSGGATLCWLLLMTLWLPLLNHARSFAPHMQQVLAQVPPDARCLYTYELPRAHIAALRYYGTVPTERWQPFAEPATRCDWMLADEARWQQAEGSAAWQRQWQLAARVMRPSDRHDFLLVLRRKTGTLLAP